jgi:hypothetical protein
VVSVDIEEALRLSVDSGSKAPTPI